MNVIAVALVPAVVASYALQPSSVLLRYKFRPGMVLRYGFGMEMKMSMAGQAQGFTTNVSTIVSEKIKSVAPDGTATVGIQSQPPTMTLNGKQMPMRPGQNLNVSGTAKWTPLGEVKDLHMSGMNQAMGAGMNPQQMQFGVPLPRATVHAGSTWSSSIDSPATGPITFQNRLERIEQRGGSTLAHIRAQGTIDLGAAIARKMGQSGSTGKMSMNMGITFNVTKGLLQQLDSDGTYSLNMRGASRGGAPAQSMSMNGTQHMRMELK